MTVFDNAMITFLLFVILSFTFIDVRIIAHFLSFRGVFLHPLEDQPATDSVPYQEAGCRLFQLVFSIVHHLRLVRHLPGGIPTFFHIKNFQIEVVIGH